ncbi:hypothetical protein [Photobacterium sp. 1_MG-2023]|uniref:hypothetical protein n=1 Tax=Photobacterium sp. 1_MG-2023 TaxID=3062646 RepID=UPI0026E34466|nr:hypothetical protein [Photobacterium sp. 1_MG-2023]MDO6707294.1 hypothetical protein [Photobacterium sp. 1_MG-2023]
MEIRAATLSDVVALQTLFHADRQLSVEAHATATQVKDIALETSVEHLSAQRLYESLSYQKNTHYQLYFKKIGVS